MKKIMRFSWLVCLIFFVTNIQAQVKFGLKAGLNFSKIAIKNSVIAVDPQALVGFHVGIIYEIPLKGNFVLQPAFMYSSKGSKYSFGGQKISISPGFLEIPVNAAYRFDLGTIKIFMSAGPYFAYGIGGKIKFGEESQSIKFGSGNGFEMQPFDTGLNFGVGLDIKNFLISFNYELSMMNLVPAVIGTYEAEAKSRVIGISMAYLFGGK